jgi:hypothetical protein
MKKLSQAGGGSRGENHREGVRLVHDTRILRYLGDAARPRSMGGAAMTYMSLRVQLSMARGAL